jgi:hypothetical protein
MVIDDLIVLGRAVPEPLKDGRITVCLGGYSPSKGFIRIYPTKINMDINQWAIIKVEVERDERDTRKESWKIAGSKNDWDNLHRHVKRVGELTRSDRLPLVYQLVTDCVNTINEAHDSLGIVKPSISANYFRENEKFGQLFQATLPGFNEGIRVKRDFPYEPRVQYRCSNCKSQNHHDQQILEWGFFRWFDKNPDKYEQVWENSHINDPDYDVYFFVGNQARYRTSFLVISVLRFKKRPFQQMLPL